MDVPTATPNAVPGSSMSISWRSWLNLLTVVPLSTVLWNDIGALWLAISD